ncbi:MAG: polysaccharide deacetylase family protein [Pseudoxanthomonas sp.]
MSSESRQTGAATALMYHALGVGETPSGQDPHYTVDLGSFGRQLDALGRSHSLGSARDWLQGTAHDVLVTFDDGHSSNYALAFPALQRRGITADFFVNPALVGTKGFATWAQLREMSDAGMSIQSHGYDHVYLTSLGDAKLRSTLQAAREEIAQHVGKPVTLLAPPGGRMPHGLSDSARECGYTHILSSRPGRINAASTDRILPRMAITAKTSTETLEAWAGSDRSAVLRERVRYGSLGLAKQLLGDARYEHVRTRALAVIRGRK